MGMNVKGHDDESLMSIGKLGQIDDSELSNGIVGISQRKTKTKNEGKKSKTKDKKKKKAKGKRSDSDSDEDATLKITAWFIEH